MLVVVNAVGDVLGPDGRILSGARKPGGGFYGQHEDRVIARGRVLESGNTTLAVAMTNAAMSKLDLFRVAQRMHDGMARAIVPAHTSFDGDTTFALSGGTAKAEFDLVAEIAAELTAVAIRRSVQSDA